MDITGGEALWTLSNGWIRPNECRKQFKIGSGAISNKIYYYYTCILKRPFCCCCKSNCHNYITLYKKNHHVPSVKTSTQIDLNLFDLDIKNLI